jgi:acyl carrier protein
MDVTYEQILATIEGVGVSIDVATIMPDTSLAKTGIDSLEMMNVFLAIEEKFGIKIPDDDIDALDTVDDIIAYLHKH